MPEVLELYNGYEIPSLFYGTYNVVDEIVVGLDAAFAAGYRAIDTASYYHNERRIGVALKMLLPKYSLGRQEIFVTSKLPPKLYGSTAAIKACHLSLSALETGYIDLYMIHWPGNRGESAHKKPSDSQGHIKEIRRQAWQALESMVINESPASQELFERNTEDETTIVGSGTYRVVRSIGVCNFLPRHVEEMANYCTIPPAVIQYECHPFIGADTLEHPMRRLCTRLFPMKPIHFQAHSTLNGGSAELLTNDVLEQIATEMKRTIPQVAIRWSLQKGHSVVVKSTRPRHILENSRVFDWRLSNECMQRIDDLACNVRCCWDPSKVP
ncbi:Aldose reductase B [Fasciola hepatica]|uniref:Aldose reductase B n=1 Tax=Fasciola hepatica TaxID=6192 RepID=A0A4E0R2P8_FASHE|nr:Aldose reductase B [Fasciola hepatica]